MNRQGRRALIAWLREAGLPADFYDEPTKTSAAEWERKMLKRGAIAAGVVALAGGALWAGGPALAYGVTCFAAVGLGYWFNGWLWGVTDGA